MPSPKNPGPVILQWYLPHELKLAKHIVPAANQPATSAHPSYADGMMLSTRTIYAITASHPHTGISLRLLIGSIECCLFCSIDLAYKGMTFFLYTQQVGRIYY